MMKKMRVARAIAEGGSCKGWLSIRFLRHVDASLVADKHTLDNGSQAPRLGATSAETSSRFIGSVLSAGGALKPLNT